MHNFFYKEVEQRIGDNLELLNRKFDKTLRIQSNRFIVNLQGEEQILIADDEFLPFCSNSFDLVVSNLNFHFINQIPEFLMQVKKILKPEGVFIASFFGEENLKELRHVLFEVENEIYAAVSPRIAPAIDVKTAAHLLQKAGFVNPIADVDRIELEYNDPLDLLKDLKLMVQGNIMLERSRKFATKNFLNEIVKKYRLLYGLENKAVKASFDIVTVMGCLPKEN